MRRMTPTITDHLHTGLYTVLAAVVLFTGLHTASVAALTLEDYGVELRSNGLVDNNTGLQWLDSAVTSGTPAVLEPYFASGWRIATESELQYLLTRTLPDGAPGGFFTNPVFYAEYVLMLDMLSIIAGDLLGSGATQPWLCRSDNVDVNCTQSGGGFFVSFYLGIEESPDLALSLAGTLVNFAVYISEVELYGDLFGPPCDGMCSGQSLLVRAIPLPAAGWLMLGGLLSLLPGRLRSSNST